MQYSDEQILAWLAGELDETQREAIETWISQSPEAQRRVAEFRQLDQLISDSINYAPPPELYDSFGNGLDSTGDPVAWKTPWLQMAAAILLLIGGFGIGRFTLTQDETAVELSAIQNEVRSLRQLVMMQTLQNPSASSRLRAIGMVEASAHIADEAVIRALVRTMSLDESPNVRYAAVQALGEFIGQDEIRARIISSLDEEEDPLVQIAMINLLAGTGDPAAIAPLRRILGDEDAMAEVRLQAEIALNMLI